MINIRERKYEIGVLRTIGMSKLKLSLQFVCEVMIVALSSIILGLGVGAITSVPVANHLLAQEIQSSEQNMQNARDNFGHGDVKNSTEKSNDNNSDIKNTTESNSKEEMDFSKGPKVDRVDKIDAVVDYKVILELIGIGMLLTIVSSCAAMVSIQRFSPLTILKERS